MDRLNPDWYCRPQASPTTCAAVKRGDGEQVRTATPDRRQAFIRNIGLVAQSALRNRGHILLEGLDKEALLTISHSLKKLRHHNLRVDYAILAPDEEDLLGPETIAALNSPVLESQDIQKDLKEIRISPVGITATSDGKLDRQHNLVVLHFNLGFAILRHQPVKDAIGSN